ncbi:MAG TPA: response regulator [Ramlibacter sp.]|nr:response regulator [Ramlibacter sp.]
MNNQASTFDCKVPRILVVDDTPDNLFLMNGLLEDRYDVVQAPSGYAGLEVVMSENPPDMVLLDIMMPDMDGYEVLRRIRQHPPTANIPVVFLTALATEQDQRLGLDLGALDYLTKPVDPDLVVQRVEAHMRATAHSRRMEALSERLSRHLQPESWSRLFHGPDQGTIAFEQSLQTVLYVECADLANWSERDRESFRAEVAWLATRHQGTVDLYAWDGTAVFFEDPAASVRMATDLQRSACELRLRMGITTSICDVASFRCEGVVQRTLIGPEAAVAAKVAATAACGSIVIAPEAYALVQAEVHADTQGCVLTEEFQDSDLATASLTPAPVPGGTAASTFAGLSMR